MSTPPTSAPVAVQANFSSSILLWVRTDQSRQTGMDYWSGPHSRIIAASKGLKEYRQMHLTADKPGRWPTTLGVETDIPDDRKVDGVAEVTFRSPLSPLHGRQTKLAFQDEINVFRRTLLYAGPPRSSRWYGVSNAQEPVGARALIYLRRRGSVRARDFRRFIKDDLAPALAATGALKELRTQSFLPWHKKLWDTPNVAHDNPRDQQLHASVILGLADTQTRDEFFEAPHARALSGALAPCTAAIHAYDVSETLTIVGDGPQLNESTGSHSNE